MNKSGISLLSILSFTLLMSSCKAQPSHNGHEYVDLGLSVKWATCNVGAQSPEDYGEYYAWGETKTKTIYTWKGYRFRVSGDSYSDVKFSKYNADVLSGPSNKTVLELADDVANVKWGGNWRIPTKEEIEELFYNCDWVWTTQNGVIGAKITSRVEGYTDRSIFMPASGYIIDSKQVLKDNYGFGWSSTITDRNTSAYCITFDLRGSYMDGSVMDHIEEIWNWHEDEDENPINDLPQTLADKLRNYLYSGKVNLDSIPESLYKEYSTYIIAKDWGVSSSARSCGLPVRPVCP